MPWQCLVETTEWTPERVTQYLESRQNQYVLCSSLLQSLQIKERLSVAKEKKKEARQMNPFPRCHYGLTDTTWSMRCHCQWAHCLISLAWLLSTLDKRGLVIGVRLWHCSSSGEGNYRAPSRTAPQVRYWSSFCAPDNTVAFTGTRERERETVELDVEE